MNSTTDFPASDDAACSPGDIANGLLHAADDHPCCRETLYAAANILSNMHTEAEINNSVSWAMKESTLEKVRVALRAGIENTDQLLMDHDRSLGRTTRKNKGEAERLEQDIRDMKSALESLMAPDGRFFPFIEENKTIQEQLGHTSLETTQLYLHTAGKTTVASPLDAEAARNISPLRRTA